MDKLATVINIDDTNSEIFELRKHNLSVSQCLHCVVLEEKLIIELLKSDSEKYTPLHVRVEKPPSDVSDISGTARAGIFQPDHTQ